MRPALLYAQVVALTVAVMAWALDLRRADLRVPFDYTVGGDALFYLPLFKTIAETGWYTENPRLGAPGEMALYDFPITETGLMLGVKALIVLTGDPFVAANLHYLLTFVASAVAALYALRALGAGGQASVAASLLFAFQPFHFWHGPFHPGLSAYHAIPLVALVALWLCGGEPLLCRRDEAGRLRLAVSRRRTVPLGIACLLASLSGPYYAYFATFLILVGGGIGLLRRPGADRVLDALAPAALLIALLAAQLVPNARYAAREGVNPLPSTRDIGWYDLCSLRVSDLVRPVPGHRVAWMDRGLPPEYTSPHPDLAWLHNETVALRPNSSLGVLGVLGFFAALALGLAAPCPPTRRTPALGDLGKLTLAALGLGLLGGFGELVALYLTTRFRCYDRVSIFIAFFALATLALLASRAGRGTDDPGPSRGRARRGWWAALWVLTGLGLLDQIPPALTLDHARDAAAFRSDRAFIARVEAALPPGSMVFQLPPNSFPEFGRHFAMYDYDHFRGYLHSRRLRWSFGAMRGRAAERLHSELAPLPPADLVDALVQAGFAGVYVNRKGHAGDAEAVIEGLRRKLGEAPIASDDGELVVFRLLARRP